MTVQKIILTYNIVRFPNGALLDTPGVNPELLPDHATADVVAARPEAGVLRDEYA